MAAALSLGACGGGSGGSQATTPPTGSTPTTPITPPPAGPTASDLALQSAMASELTGVYDLATNMTALTWKDSFPAGTSFQVQSRVADGSFAPVEDIAGSGGSGGTLVWRRAGTVSTAYRVVAMAASGAVDLRTAQGESIVIISVPTSPPEIAMDKAEPVADSVRLSISNNFNYPKTEWFSDLRKIGTGSGPGVPVTWDTSIETNGAHAILARIQTGADSYLQVGRTVQVSNANLVVTATFVRQVLNVSASAAAGIARVSAQTEGISLGTLTEKNGCGVSVCGGILDTYQFRTDAIALGSGMHVFTVTAVDNAGNSKSTTITVNINNAPTVSITSPADGAIVFRTLNLTGTATSDKADRAIKVVASLGDLQFLNTTQTNFSTTLDLSGVGPGAYTLNVSATDSYPLTVTNQRMVTVASSAATAYTPAFAIGFGGSLLAVDGDHVLYKSAAGPVHVRNSVTGSDVILADSSASFSHWALASGHAFASSYTSASCDGNPSCVHEWLPDGTHQMVPKPPNSQDLDVVAHGAYALWSRRAGDAADKMVLYKLSSGVQTLIAKPTGAAYIGNNAYDFTIKDGNILVFYWAATAADPSKFDIYRWSSADETSTKLTSGDARDVYPGTDGEIVAWLSTPSPNAPSQTLKSEPVLGGPEVDLSTQVEKFMSADGVTAWTETGGTSNRTIKARYQGTTRTIASSTTVVFYAVGGGFVIYGDQNKIYSWKASTGISTLRLDSSPAAAKISGNILYVLLGADLTVYRIPLG